MMEGKPYTAVVLLKSFEYYEKAVSPGEGSPDPRSLFSAQYRTAYPCPGLARGRVYQTI